MKLVKSEPAVVIGTVTTAVAAILAVLVAFGIDLSPGQQVAILGVIAGVGPLVVAFVTRSQVSPASTVVAQYKPGSNAVIAGPASVLAVGAPVEVWPLGTPAPVAAPIVTPPTPPVAPPPLT